MFKLDILMILYKGSLNWVARARYVSAAMVQVPTREKSKAHNSSCELELL